MALNGAWIGSTQATWMSDQVPVKEESTANEVRTEFSWMLWHCDMSRGIAWKVEHKGNLDERIGAPAVVHVF
jgi:hypothetical protein